MDSSLFEAIGRKQFAIDKLNTDYDQALALLAEVISGKIPPHSVLVNHTERSWSAVLNGLPHASPAQFNGLPVCTVGNKFKADPSQMTDCEIREFLKGVPHLLHKRGRGRKVESHIVKARHERAAQRHGDHVAKLPVCSAPTFDCRTTFNNVLPTDDQGQCGDCFGVSSTDGCSMALIKAGILPLDPSKGRLSSQYGLDCGKFDGGCGGGDEAQVIEEIMNNGFPLTSDYGPYTASSGHCKTGFKMYKIKNFGYCTPSQEEGVANVQDIKNCMAQYGPISVAFDASACDSYSWPNIMKGGGSSVDHAVLCIGWDDSKQAFLGMNQWGTSWGGPNCTFWIAYGSYSWGTEAIWIDGGAGPNPNPIPGQSPVPSPH